MTAVMQQPLPAGTVADPTYLAFLRGMGMDASTAQATAIAHIAAAKASYATAMQREPGILEQGIRGVNGAYSGNDNWWSGGRLTDVARQRVLGQDRQHDYQTAEAQQISDANLARDQAISNLNRQNVDAIGALQGRHDAMSMQDQYINAVRQQSIANANAANGGSSGYGYTPPPIQVQGQPGQPSPHDLAVINGLSPADLARFQLFVAGMPKPPAPPGQQAYQGPGGPGVSTGFGSYRS